MGSLFWVGIVTGLVVFGNWVNGSEFEASRSQYINETELSLLEAHEASASLAGRSPLMVGLTLIHSAAAKGAVCLDGTLPGYHLDRAFGSEANSWLVNLEGGGWCNDVRTCVYRKKSRRGSSTFMEKEIPFTGIMSNKAEENPGSHSVELPELLNLYFSFYLPIGLAVWFVLLFLVILDFFNWNRVKIRYCDGASFAGDGEDKVDFESWSPCGDI